MFLHPEEGQFTMVSSELQKAQSSYNKRQDTAASNRKSYQQTKGGKILQQT